MANIIYDYPKSSCTCYKCDKNTFKKSEGVATNMSVHGCEFSPYYDCFSRRVFNEEKIPNTDNQLRAFSVEKIPKIDKQQVILNPSAITNNKFAQNFRAIDVKDCPKSACKGVTYFNSDPRLVNAAGPSWLQLDRPPLMSTLKLSSLNDNKELDNYGQNYNSYADVNAGQILYYVNKDIGNAFYEPVFSQKATSVGSVYQDPMGNMKPQYDHIPEKQYDPLNENPSDVTGDYCLSWLRDSQYHREDLLASQMAVINQQKFTPRWNNVTF